MPRPRRGGARYDRPGGAEYDRHSQLELLRRIQPPRWLAYHVDWSDGPTRAGMRQLVDQAAGDVADPIAGLHPAELVYVRTVQPAAVALAMLGNVTAGRPALGPHRHVYALEQALDAVEHSERGTDEALQLAARLGRLSGWNTDRMAELLDAHGLAALTGQLDPDPDGTVVPLGRPAEPDRGQGRRRGR